MCRSTTAVQLIIKRVDRISILAYLQDYRISLTTFIFPVCFDSFCRYINIFWGMQYFETISRLHQFSINIFFNDQTIGPVRFQFSIIFYKIYCCFVNATLSRWFEIQILVSLHFYQYYTYRSLIKSRSWNLPFLHVIGTISQANISKMKRRYNKTVEVDLLKTIIQITHVK